MHVVTWHVREQTLQRVTQDLTFAKPTVTSKRRRHRNHKIRGDGRLLKSYALYCNTVTGLPTKRTCAMKNLINRCSVHVCVNSALDVSKFWSPMSEEADITQTRGTNSANSCICHHGKMVALLMVYMALTSFAIITPVAKMVQVSVCWCRQSHT